MAITVPFPPGSSPPRSLGSRRPGRWLRILLGVLTVTHAAGCHHALATEPTTAAPCTDPPPAAPSGPCDAHHRSEALTIARQALQHAFSATDLGTPTATFGVHYAHPQLRGAPPPTPVYGWYVQFPTQFVLGGNNTADRLAMHLLGAGSRVATAPPSTPTMPAPVPGQIAEARPADHTTLPLPGPPSRPGAPVAAPVSPVGLRPANARTVAAPLVPARAEADLIHPVNVDASGTGTLTATSPPPATRQTLPATLEVFVAVDGTASIL